ncbi:hypothetical protein ABLN72_14560, partial [Mycobacterium tuberculosis]
CTSFSYQFGSFNLQASQHFHCFRIYRATLSRFSCAASPSPGPVVGELCAQPQEQIAHGDR